MPTKAEIEFAEFKGDNLSVKMFVPIGAPISNTLRSTGGISATSANLLLTESGFRPADIGKKITVMGAGASGLPLGTTIQSYASPTQVTLADIASTTVSGAVVSWGTDDRPAFLRALIAAKALQVGLFMPSGDYTLSGALALSDALGVSLFGDGPTSNIIPWGGWAGGNLFDLSGSRDLVLKNFRIDGSLLVRAAVDMSAIYSDGTVATPIHGNIRCENLTIANWEQQGLGLGANLGYTAEDMQIIGCRFPNFGSLVFGAHPIDAGSSGTKRKYKINRNRMDWRAGYDPALSFFNGIFCGHGLNDDFDLIDNYGENCPGDFIQLHSRPFLSGGAAEVTRFEGATVIGNTAKSPGRSGLAFYGVKYLEAHANRVMNPGTHATNEEGKSACLVSHGISGPSTKYAGRRLDISSNVFVDDRGSPLMTHGVYDSHDVGFGAIKSNYDNAVEGHTMAEFKSTATAPDWTIRGRGTGGRFGYGKVDPIDQLDNAGNARFTHPANPNVFLSASIESAGTSPNYYGFGNVRYDSAAALWRSVFDGSNNGFSMLLFSMTDGSVRFVLEPSVGNIERTYTNTAFGALGRLVFSPKTNGIRIDMIGNLGIAVDPNATENLLLNTLRILTSLKLDYGTADRPVLTDGAKGLISGKISFTNANHIDISGIGDTEFMFRSGTAVGSGKVALTNSVHVTASGLGANQALTWNGSAVTDIPGVTSSPNIITSLGVSSSTLNYKDHAGTNQTMTVVNSLSPTSVTANFVEGIWTS